MAALTNRWAVLGLMFLAGITLPTQFQSVPALAPFLVAEGRLSYTDIGVLTGLFMFPGIFLAAPAGLLAARIGDRLTLVIGMTLMFGAALLFSVAESYSAMFASRLLGGAGGLVITVLLPKVITDWFAGKEIATAMATIASSFGFGIGLAMAVLPAIAAATAWQIALFANAGLVALAIVLLLAIYRDLNPGARGPLDGLPAWRISPPELVLSALGGVGRGLFSSGYVVFMSFLPALLIAQGLRVADAGLLTSVAAAVSLASVPLGGFLSDRTGKPAWFIVGGSVGTALSCIFVPYVAPALLWVVMFGLLRGGCTGGIMALPSQVLRPESRSTGFAVVSAMYFVCMAAFPPIAGFMLDATGNSAAPLWFAGLLWLLISALLAAFKALQRKWVPATPN